MKYLVCYDGSTEAGHTLDFVKNHANKETDEIVLFGAFAKLHDPHAEVDIPGSIYIPPHEEWAQQEHKRRENVAKYRLNVAADQLQKAGFKHVKQLTVESDDVRDSVMKTVDTEHADAVVVGSRGYSNLKAMMLGSLSSYLVNNAKVPVVVARGAATNNPV